MRKTLRTGGRKNRVDLIGKRFGRLVVKKEGRKRKGVRYYWCRCSCGKWVLVRMSSLRLKTPHATSCGCLCRGKGRHFKHGLTNSKAYRAWDNAKSRCSNPKATSYSQYGGKGI